jgi:hypothetical protein
MTITLNGTTGINTPGVVNTAAQTVATTLTVTGVSTLTGGFTVGATAAPAFSAYLGSAQTVTSGVETKVTINTEEFDTASAYDKDTNYRFTPLVAGYYQINGSVYPSTTTTITSAVIWKNGARYKFTTVAGSNSSANTQSIVYFNGTTDYVELYTIISGVTPGLNTGIFSCSFSGCLVRSA